MKNKRGDARSDLYAVGVILYEMLTGETPFHGANPFAVMNARLVTPPQPPREINPGIPAPLEHIVMRVLERDPNRRYYTTQEFADDLAHPDELQVDDRPALVDLRQRPHRQRSLLSRLMLTLLPALLLVFLLLIARTA